MADKVLYAIELDLTNFGIKNDGTSPKETSIGLNKALQYAKGHNFDRIIFPTGIYLIDETNPITIDLKNIVVDLNGSTLQINTNGLEKYSIVQFIDGAENVRLTNGTVRGDKDTHDYLTIKSSHEWGWGVAFKGGKNLQMDNVTVTNVTGYGIYTASGNAANKYYNLYARNTTLGAISDDGKMIESKTQIRTIQAYDMSVCGGQFELGYSTGYQGYPYLTNREYTAYFYDKNMKFVEKRECIQFRKTDIPVGAKYAHFIYPQATLNDSPNGYAIISNYRPPTDVKVTNCLIQGNRSLGLAYCGGQRWTIENNIFEGNGGNAPNLAVDFEDGWDLMQDVMFRNNKFINNNDDLVVVAGDNLVFEGNEFNKGVVINSNGRTMNYKFLANRYDGGYVYYRIKRENCEIRGNRYINCRVNTESQSSLTFTLNDETLTDSGLYAAPGTKLINCVIQTNNKPFIKNAVMENCTLELAGAEAFNLTIKNSKIRNSKINLHAEHFIEGCEITDSILSTHADTIKIHLKSSNFVNSQMLYATWGAAAETIIDQCTATMTANLPLVRLSAGKTRNLIFQNNTVINQTPLPVIELYDTIYTVPNGNATIEGNSFTQYSNYVFDGVKITQGIFNLTVRNNTTTDAQMINPKYIGNPFFIIKD